MLLTNKDTKIKLKILKNIIQKTITKSNVEKLFIEGVSL